MSRQSGFNLVELMVIIAVMGTLVALAYPSFQDTILLNRVQSQTTRMISTLHMARSEAVKANRVVVMCKSSNQDTCTNAGEWEQGWVVFRDDNNNNTRESDEPLVTVSGPVATGVTIRAGASFANFLPYRADGTTGLLTANVEDQSFKVCHKLDTRYSRQVFIDVSGRARVDTSGVSTCTLP